jgi:transcriptional regulator with XRE-family HTH domain
MVPTLQQQARNQIRHWIRSTGITQTALAERIKRNQAWMSRYLAGDIDADVDTLQQMAEVFGHNLTQMLDVPTDPEEAALITAYRALRPDARLPALRVVQEMARGRTPAARGSGRSRA